MSESNSIFQKLRQVQLELKAPKSNYNSFAKFYYRSAEDIVEAVKPLCDKYGLTLVLSDSMEMLGNRYYVVAKATVFDDEGSSIPAQGVARESETKKGMDDSQISGTASSYARKYALNGLFAIDDTKDADSDEHHNQTTQPDKRQIGRASEAGQGATQFQRDRIKQHLEKQGIPIEDMSAYIEREYGHKVPLTASAAREIIDRIITENDK